ncbi:MAG TPA: MFS transporter [Propionicimonas sp.]|nr:MFS transporter [Propionicimonas sp.]HRA05858.1 MFS transporter [Propionicimonas sp.]
MTTTASTSRLARKPGQVVPLLTRIAYMFGETGSQFTWSLVSSYLVLFYTDIALLAPATIAVIMLVARIWDAVDDPVQGYLAERTNTKWGRFRPWMIFGAPLLAAFVVLTFVAPSFGDNMGAKAIYAGVTYILLGVFYSAVNMTYGAMAGVMTKDYDERLTLNWWRGLGGGVGTLILNAVTMPLILFFSSPGGKPDANGFLVTAAILAVAALPMFWFTAFTAKEVIAPPPSETRVPLAVTVKTVLGNKPLLLVWATLLLILIGLFGRLGIVIFYVMNNMGNPMYMAGVMTAFGFGDIAGKLLFPRLASKFGKKQMTIVSALASAAVLFAIFLAPASNVGLITALHFIYGMCGFAGVITLSMIPDCVDYQEYKHGVRSDGTAYAFVSFSTKVASAVGGAVGALMLGWFGYIPGAPAGPETLNGINIATNVIPALLAIAGAVAIFFYPLTHARMAEIRAELDARGAAKEAAEAAGA